MNDNIVYLGLLMLSQYEDVARKVINCQQMGMSLIINVQTQIMFTS